MRALLNFRFGLIGIVADSEKALLQIAFKENERDYHSLLWFNKLVEQITDLTDCVRYRMKRVTFGVTCSPFFLSVTIRKHLKEQPEHLREICEILNKCLYVDNLVTAVDETKSEISVYKQSKFVMSLANINLHKWQTNCNVLRNEFHFENESSDINVLGMSWNTMLDEIGVDLKPVLND